MVWGNEFPYPKLFAMPALACCDNPKHLLWGAKVFRGACVCLFVSNAEQLLDF